MAWMLGSHQTNDDYDVPECTVRQAFQRRKPKEKNTRKNKAAKALIVHFHRESWCMLPIFTIIVIILIKATQKHQE